MMARYKKKWRSCHSKLPIYHYFSICSGAFMALVWPNKLDLKLMVAGPHGLHLGLVQEPVVEE